MEETTKQTLATKLTHVAAACGYVQKDASNAFHKYRYVSAANILGHVNEALCAHGLAVVETEPQILSENGAGKERVVTVRMRVVVQDADSGERAIFVGLGSGQDAGDKAVMKASTAALKYAWMGALSISTGDDPEADADTDKRGTKNTRTVPPPPPDRSTAKTVPVPPPTPTRVTTDLDAFRSRFAGLKSREDAAQLWVDWRDRLRAIEGADIAGWGDLADLFARRGWKADPHARGWLKRASAEIAARTTRPDNDPQPSGPSGPSGGTRRPQSTTATNASGSAQESHGSGDTSASRWSPVTTSEGVVIDTEEGARAHLARLHPVALQHSFARHIGHRAWCDLVVHALAARERIGADVARLRLTRSVGERKAA